MNVEKHTRIDYLCNWADPMARFQIINAVVFQTVVMHKLKNLAGWKKSARNKLSSYGITLTEGTLGSIVSKLRRKEREPEAASIFRGNGEIYPRPGKDLMYAEFNQLVDLYLQDVPQVYVGLPADQILSVAYKYATGVACERSDTMYKYMSRLKEGFYQGSNIEIHHGDIFKYLGETDNKFSIYDFDLMCFATPSVVSEAARIINRTAHKVAVINFVSCVGRKCTIAEYQAIMPGTLIKSLNGYGWTLIYKRLKPGKYDDTWPMRYEHIVIKKG